MYFISRTAQGSTVSPIEDQGYGCVVIWRDERHGRSEPCRCIWSGAHFFYPMTFPSDSYLQCLRGSFPKRNVNRFSAVGQAVRACGSKEVTQYGVMPRLHPMMMKETIIHTESSSLSARRFQYRSMTGMPRHHQWRKHKARTTARYRLHGRT